MLSRAAFLCAVLCSAGTAADPPRWIPAQYTSWQWQLSGAVDDSIDVVLYDIDLFNNTAEFVSSLHAKGRKAVCYLSAGTWEPGRPDSGLFPEQIKGKPVQGFGTERWLDIRRLDILQPIMEARLDLCRAKGFDAVEPDNVDGFDNNTGFALSYADQLAYNQFLAGAAHKRGLSAGLKNDLAQAADLAGNFDWAINEQCFEYNECDALQPFSDARKAVFHVEYSLETGQFCPAANARNFNSMRKHVSLDAFREPCRTEAGRIRAEGIVNAGSYLSGPVAPGEVITVFASNAADGTSGTVLTFDGQPAPLLYAGTGQINAVAPYDIDGRSTVQLQVSSSAGVTNGVVMDVAPASPALFTMAGGAGQAAALNADGTVNSPGSPAIRDGVVVLFATGGGRTSPPQPDGSVPTGPGFAPALPTVVRIGGREAAIRYAGAAPFLIAGVLQINAQIPGDVEPGDHVPVALVIGGAASQPGVTIAVR